MEDGAEDQPWPLWEDSTKWPLAPAGFVFLADAARRLLGSDYDDRHWRDNYQRPETIRWLHYLVANGYLSSVFWDEQSGDLIPLEASDWNRDFSLIEERFRTCLYRSQIPPQVQQLLPASWPCGIGSIYVTSGSLMNALRAQPGLAREKRRAEAAKDPSSNVRKTKSAEPSCVSPWMSIRGRRPGTPPTVLPRARSACWRT